MKSWWTVDHRSVWNHTELWYIYETLLLRCGTLYNSVISYRKVFVLSVTFRDKVNKNSHESSFWRWCRTLRPTSPGLDLCVYEIAIFVNPFHYIKRSKVIKFLVYGTIRASSCCYLQTRTAAIFSLLRVRLYDSFYYLLWVRSNFYKSLD